MTNDDEVRDRLRLAIRRNGLAERMRDEDCAIVTREHTRTIACRYRVPLELLPGRSGFMRFGLHVEEPYLAPEKTLFF